MAYLSMDVVMDELPTVKHAPETGKIRVFFGLHGHLSLAIDEAAHLVTELAAALGEAQGAEIEPRQGDF
ncbi:hypothetical protein [Rhodococcus sp. USK13]|uniref:hypothetical protein n=1 Tax=Rhodococcus sp. USK13 TaxID=2806442 RepID=UPI001BCD0DE8|nr:hypothetical protein [Rhodococcus sp. USK13]